MEDLFVSHTFATFEFEFVYDWCMRDFNAVADFLEILCAQGQEQLEAMDARVYAHDLSSAVTSAVS